LIVDPEGENTPSALRFTCNRHRLRRVLSESGVILERGLKRALAEREEGAAGVGYGGTVGGSIGL